VRDGLFGQFLAVHREHARYPPLPGPGPSVFEVKDDGMFARLERPAKQVIAENGTDAALPAESLQIEKVVNKDRLAMLQEQARSRRNGRQ